MVGSSSSTYADIFHILFFRLVDVVSIFVRSFVERWTVEWFACLHVLRLWKAAPIAIALAFFLSFFSFALLLSSASLHPMSHCSNISIQRKYTPTATKTLSIKRIRNFRIDRHEEGIQIYIPPHPQVYKSITRCNRDAQYIWCMHKYLPNTIEKSAIDWKNTAKRRALNVYHNTIPSECGWTRGMGLCIGCVAGRRKEKSCKRNRTNIIIIIIIIETQHAKRLEIHSRWLRTKAVVHAMYVCRVSCSVRTCDLWFCRPTVAAAAARLTNRTNIWVG